MLSDTNEGLLSKKNLLFCGFILVLSYFTYVHNYSNPPFLFWDENYHIASAQKHMNGTFFMEPHPPLGKLMIGWGEQLLDKNPADDQFLNTNYARKLPANFSFAGYRLFPTVMAWLIAPTLFFIFLVLTRRALYATLFTFPYVFDNAIIVHSRAAHLDQAMILFSVLMILFFLLCIEWRDRPKPFGWAAFFFGMSFGLLMVTKILGLVMILLLIPMVIVLYPNTNKIWHWFALAMIGFLIPYIGVWQMHFANADTLNPKLPNQGYFQASDGYKYALDMEKTGSIAAFPVMLRDNLTFTSHYAGGVPRLNMCKADENGSPFYLWPVGGHSINYRWETPDGTHYKYLYLIANPIGWLTAFAAVLLAGGFLSAYIFFDAKPKLKRPLLLATFFGLYASYMIAVAQLGRVMYMYHYFMPLVFGFILIALVFQEISSIGTWKLTDHRRGLILLIFGFLVFLVHLWIRPLTYYEPVTDKQVQRRSLMPVWEMHCVKCPRFSSYVVRNKK